MISGTSYDLQKRQGSPLYKLLTVTVSWREHLKPTWREIESGSSKRLLLLQVDRWISSLDGTQVLLSCIAGPLVGHHIFVTEMSSYWMHQAGVTYKDVVLSLVSIQRHSHQRSLAENSVYLIQVHATHFDCASFLI